MHLHPKLDIFKPTFTLSAGYLVKEHSRTARWGADHRHMHRQLRLRRNRRLGDANAQEVIFTITQELLFTRR